MLRRTALVAVARTPCCLNFFPLGRSSGPKRIQKVLPPNLMSPGMMSMPKLVADKETKVRNYVPRSDLKLLCECCKFYWHHDALAIRCTANREHNQHEAWLKPNWSYFARNPLNFNKYIFANVHPRTGALLNHENSASRSNERRGAGFSGRTLALMKESRVVSRKVSGVGVYSTGFRVRFPTAS